MNAITGADIDALATGSSVLGCGGGGKVGMLLSALHARGQRLDVRVLPPDAGLDHFVAVSFLGSTTVLGEKLPSGAELPAALRAVERWTGIPASAIIPAQIGGITALGATMLADELALPLLDADLVGRATPRLDQMSIFARHRPELTVAAVTSSGLVTVVSAASPIEVESALRGAVAASGGWAGFALGPLPLGLLRDDLVHASITRALAVGRGFADPDASADAVARALGGRIVARGRVLDIERHDDRVSFVHGSAAFVDPATGAVGRLEMGSEYLYLVVDGTPAASVPDIISVLDSRTRAAVGADDLRPGMEIDVLTLPAAPIWRSAPEFLRRADPRFYGIDADPTPSGAPR